MDDEFWIPIPHFGISAAEFCGQAEQNPSGLNHHSGANNLLFEHLCAFHRENTWPEKEPRLEFQMERIAWWTKNILFNALIHLDCSNAFGKICLGPVSSLIQQVLICTLRNLGYNTPGKHSLLVNLLMKWAIFQDNRSHKCPVFPLSPVHYPALLAFNNRNGVRCADCCEPIIINAALTHSDRHPDSDGERQRRSTEFLWTVHQNTANVGQLHVKQPWALDSICLKYRDFFFKNKKQNKELVLLVKYGCVSQLE